MFEKIGTFLGGIALAVAGFFGVTPAQETKIVEVPQSIPYEQVATPQKQILTVNSSADEETLGGFSPAAGGTYRLRTSIGSTDTSITLSSFKEPITGNAFTMTTLNTDIGYATLDPQSPTRKELISFTGVTQSSDGSAVLTGVSRGLAFQYPYTASSTLRKSHPGQSILILSDAPQVFNEYGRLRSNEIVTGQWTFSTFPITPSTTPASATTTGSSQLATGLQAASSTAFGSTGHRLTLSTLISTSTGGTAYTVPVTDSTGKIDGAFCCSNNSITLQGTTTGVGKVDVYTSIGTTTWTKPTGAKFVTIILIGGGGGGASGDSNPSTVQNGGGGGGGGYTYTSLPAYMIPSTANVVVGDGGAGGIPQTGNGSGNTGNTGSSTCFGTFICAYGGVGGSANNVAGSGGFGHTATGTNGSGSQLQFNLAGAGAYGSRSNYPQVLKGTDGAVSTAGTDGESVATSTPAGGAGGGQGGQGALSGSNGGRGGNGGRYGGGGGGGGWGDSDTADSGAGGDGGDGIAVIITY